MIPTPTDPAAIDLDALATKHATGGLLPSEVDNLFAAVEELRERVALERAGSKHQAYLERNHLAAALARLYPSGTARTDIPGWSPDWHGCVYIDLPAGQISYHYHDSQVHLFAGLPAYEGHWDGHNKAEVHRRLARLGQPTVAPAKADK